jgi:hypothetical protein
VGYPLLALLLTSQLLIFDLLGQETPRVHRAPPAPHATTFPVWLMRKVDAKKIRVGDEIRFKSYSGFLIGKTVIPSAIFCGRVVYVQRPDENEERESRLGIVVEQVKWKSSSLWLNAYIVGFGSYRVTTENLGKNRQPDWFENRPPGTSEFEQSSGSTPPANVKRRFSTDFDLDSLRSIGENRRDVRTLDYSESITGVYILQTTVDGKHRTILVRRDKNIVLPKYLPVMLEQIDEQ